MRCEQFQTIMNLSLQSSRDLNRNPYTYFNMAHCMLVGFCKVKSKYIGLILDKVGGGIIHFLVC